MKKDQLNKKLYQTHLEVTQEWGNTWHTIRDCIHANINKDMERKYNTIKQKLEKLEHTQANTPKHLKTFYPRVINNTNIKFTSDELILLNKGLKYNLSYKNKNWIKTLTLETESAITQLPAHEQEYVRTLAAHNLRQLYKWQIDNKQYNSNQATREHRVLKQIKEKLQSNEAIVSKADKGNSVVILYLQDYHNKVQDFINKNNFTVLNKDPTQSFQNQVKATIKSCQSILPKNSITKVTNVNPTAPNIRGLPKVHKIECLMRPIVNWKGAPAYKLAKYLNKLIQLHIPLPNAFNIKSSTHLMDDLLDIPHRQGIKFASFDIENMYPNIPTNELTPIIRYMSLNNQLDAKTIDELIKVTHTVLEQNYFTFRNGNYSQTTGLAMGAPSSSILSEIYLQHLEYTKIVDIITQQNIIRYFRFVDDILVVYNQNSTDIHEVHKALNNLAPTIKFTLENEINGCINFVDFTIQNNGNKLLFNIYRKPTATDIIIPKDSCHPPEQKHAAIRHMVNRKNTYRLDNDNKRTEHQTIEQIITSNGYETSIIDQLNKHGHKDNANNTKHSWAKFTYFGGEKGSITKLQGNTGANNLQGQQHH